MKKIMCALFLSAMFAGSVSTAHAGYCIPYINDHPGCTYPQ